MSITHMYSNTVVSLASAAVVDVQQDGKLVGVSWCGYAQGAATAAMKLELSFGSSIADTTNDAKQVIDTFTVATPTAAHYSDNKFTAMDVDIQAGERIYLHAALGGTTMSAAKWQCVLHIQDKAGRTTLRRR